MSSDYIEMLREATERAKPTRAGITVASAVADTLIDSVLFADYASLDRGRASIAAFRIEALLGSVRKKEFTASDIAQLHHALWSRIGSPIAPVVAADISVACFTGLEEAEKKRLVHQLFARLKGESDYWLIAYSGLLVPVLGIEYLYEFESSDVMGESGGMGGPMRYHLRDFALERICAHLNLTPRLIDHFDARASWYSWIDVPGRRANKAAQTTPGRRPSVSDL